MGFSFGRNFVMPNDLQSVRSLSIKGYSAPALRSDAGNSSITTPPCPPPAHACTSRGNTQEVDVSIRGKVLRSLALDPSASAPVAEGSSGLVVDEGPPDRRLELLDQTHGWSCGRWAIPSTADSHLPLRRATIDSCGLEAVSASPGRIPPLSIFMPSICTSQTCTQAPMW